MCASAATASGRAGIETIKVRDAANNTASTAYSLIFDNPSMREGISENVRNFSDQTRIVLISDLIRNF